MRRKRAAKVYFKKVEPHIGPSTAKVVPRDFSQIAAHYSQFHTDQLTHHNALFSFDHPWTSLRHQLWSAQNSADTRKGLLVVSTVNALLGVVMSLAGYQVVAFDEVTGKDVLKMGLGLASVAQIGLVVLYCSLWQRWLESLRHELKLSPEPINPLCKSRKAQVVCGLECCFHALVPLPYVDCMLIWELWGNEYAVTLDYCLYVLVLLRSYHCLQLLFFLSPLSARRAEIFTKLTNVQLSLIFIVKYFLAEYSFRLLMGLYLVLMTISGVSVFMLDRGSANTHFFTVNNAIWLVAQTQTTIGYGDVTPITFLTYLILAISCIVGNFVLSILVGLISRAMSLSLAESSLYTHIAYAKEQRKHVTPAVRVIQAWWRLILMRLHHHLDAHTIVHYYSEQGAYQSVREVCERAKDHNLEGQIDAFQARVSNQCHHMIDYLQPILDAHALVPSTQTTDILRAQYSIKHKVQTLAQQFRPRLAHFHMPLNGPSHMHSRKANSSQSSRSGFQSSASTPMHNMAKAKMKAQKKLIGRLLQKKSINQIHPRSDELDPSPEISES